MGGNANSGGQNRKPTAMKVLEGTLRADRVTPNEPEVKLVKIPPAPLLKLNEPGIEEWERSTRTLIDSGVLSEGDLSALSAMCYEWGQYCECGVRHEQNRTFDVELKVNDMDHKDRLEWMRVKYLASKNLEKLRKEHLEAYSKMAQQFGLTPVSRARVAGVKKKEADELDLL